MATMAKKKYNCQTKDVTVKNEEVLDWGARDRLPRRITEERGR